ncbi:DUF5011 domain-containing protein, partial [Listeria grandensis]|uniref:immunoglobulin-like domain-containing protein n=1 Tax=Listeria grandensis TaxID=1494963 RepID=UPI001626F199
MNRKLDRTMRFLKCFLALILLMSTCLISVSQVSAAGSIYNTSNDIEFSKKDTSGLREYDGKIKFDLPAAQTSKGNDIIFLRDTSGSFSAHTRQLTEAISEIAEEVDLSQDRIMVINTMPATRASVTVPLTDDLKVIKDGLTRTAASTVTADSGFEYALTNYNGSKGNTDNNTIFILISDNDAYGVQRTVDGAAKVKNAGHKVGGIYIGSSAASIANGKKMVSDPSYFYQFTNMTQGIDALRELTQTMYETEDAQMEWTLDDAFDLLDVSAKDQDGKEIPVQVSGNTVTLVTPQDAAKSVTLQYSFKEKKRLLVTTLVGIGSVNASLGQEPIPDVFVSGNNDPVIYANDRTITAGTSFDPLENVTASDIEDGDLTSDIQIISNDVNTKKEGVYSVTYAVTDSDNNTTKKTITVNVNASPPTVKAQDMSAIAGISASEVSWFTNVTAEDKVDGDISSDVSVDYSSVDFQKEGDYPVVYSVTNSNGKSASTTVNMQITAEAPVIQAKDMSAIAGTKASEVSWFTNVTAQDKVDGDISLDVSVDYSSVNFQKEGNYPVVYSVTNSNGKSASTTVNMQITAEAPVIHAKDMATIAGTKPTDIS